MPKSDVKNLFAAFGASADSYKELSDDHAGRHAQASWPLLRSLSGEARRDAPADGIEQAKAADSVQPPAAEAGHFPLLGNIRLASPPLPRAAAPVPKAQDGAKGDGSLNQLFTRLSGDQDRGHAGADEMPSAIAGGDSLASVFSRLSGQERAETPSPAGADLFSRLRK
jgi:hypothetical protein